jgi:hypothetical protein
MADEIAVFPPGPQEWLTSAELVRTVAPSVKGIREELFGSAKPPFRTLTAAVRWIEQPAHRQRPGEGRDEEALRRIAEFTAEMKELTGRSYSVRLENPVLSYVKSGEPWIRRMGCAPGSRLARLASVSQAVAKATGWPEGQVVTHILTGRQPTSPLATIKKREGGATLPAGEHLGHKAVVVTFEAPELNESQWRRLRQKVRQSWNAGRRKALTEKDKVVWKAVQRCGGVPETGRTAFWEQVREDCERQGVYYSNWRGPYMQYKRFRRKLDERRQ